MKKIITVVGARPQFIKAAPISRVIAGTEGISEVLLHSGQHFDDNMSDVFFRQLEIPEPIFNLGIQGGTHGSMTGRMLEKIEAVLVDEAPDLVIVYGDTNTTLAAALAAAKLHIRIAHIEAGLRSWNRQMPEEINRVLTDHVSQILFCPTFQAVKNLENEGITDHVFHSGDVMYDAALMAAQRADKQILKRLGADPGDYFLATLHRAENTDDKRRLTSILEAFGVLGQTRKLVLPLHPRTHKKIREFGLEHLISGLTVIEPVSFLEMVALEKSAAVILTDSGGVQKEAYFHSVPCVTLRGETEWTETVEAGWNTLTGPDKGKILEALKQVGTGRHIEEYGQGDASVKIVEEIKKILL